MRARRLPLASALVAFGALAGCASPGGMCPPIKSYTGEFSTRLATEVAAMPEGSAALTAIEDYIGLRDQLRACQ